MLRIPPYLGCSVEALRLGDGVAGIAAGFGAATSGLEGAPVDAGAVAGVMVAQPIQIKLKSSMMFKTLIGQPPFSRVCRPDEFESKQPLDYGPFQIEGNGDWLTASTGLCIWGLIKTYM